MNKWIFGAAGSFYMPLLAWTSSVCSMLFSVTAGWFSSSFFAELSNSLPSSSDTLYLPMAYRVVYYYALPASGGMISWLSCFTVVGAGHCSNSARNIFISSITKVDKLVLTRSSSRPSEFIASSMSKSEVILSHAEQNMRITSSRVGVEILVLSAANLSSTSVVILHCGRLSSTNDEDPYN